MCFLVATQPKRGLFKQYTESSLIRAGGKAGQLNVSKTFTYFNNVSYYLKNATQLFLVDIKLSDPAAAEACLVAANADDLIAINLAPPFGKFASSSSLCSLTFFISLFSLTVNAFLCPSFSPCPP